MEFSEPARAGGSLWGGSIPGCGCDSSPASLCRQAAAPGSAAFPVWGVFQPSSGRAVGWVALCWPWGWPWGWQELLRAEPEPEQGLAVPDSFPFFQQQVLGSRAGICTLQPWHSPCGHCRAQPSPACAGTGQLCHCFLCFTWCKHNTFSWFDLCCSLSLSHSSVLPLFLPFPILLASSFPFFLSQC